MDNSVDAREEHSRRDDEKAILHNLQEGEMAQRI
jgi:hypothetical protein